MFTNEIRPYKSHADHRKQTCDTHSVTQVSVLDVEARRFHGTECRFNLPAIFIGSYSILILSPVEGLTTQISVSVLYFSSLSVCMYCHSIICKPINSFV